MQSANNVRSIVSFESIPENKLGLIVMKGCKDLGTRVDQYLVKWRQEYAGAEQKNLPGYVKESFILDAETPRFGSGEAKGQINATVRGYDLYILVDVTNYSLTYTVSGHGNGTPLYQNRQR